jgi:hypothetical protein
MTKKKRLKKYRFRVSMERGSESSPYLLEAISSFDPKEDIVEQILIMASDKLMIPVENLEQGYTIVLYEEICKPDRTNTKGVGENNELLFDSPARTVYLPNKT